MHLVFNQDSYVVPWICDQLFIRDPGPCAAIGIAKQEGLIGAALYHNQHLDTAGKPFMIEISFATIDKTWASRGNIYALLAYPFCQLKVKRAQSTVSKRNKLVRQFLERLGFTLEGIGRQAWPHGGDAAVYSMLSGEFFSSRWNIKNGQKLPLSTSSSQSTSYVSRPNCEQQGNGALSVRA